MRRSFAERSGLAEDNLSIFLGWLNGHIITTRHVPKGRGKSQDIKQPTDTLRGKPYARVAINDEVMFITVNAMHDWCKEHKQIPEKIRDQLITQGYINRETRERIGKGTLVTTGQARVYEMNYAKIMGHLHVVPTSRDGEETTEPETEVTQAVT